MDIDFPFVRCFPKRNRCTDRTARSVYYLANYAGDIEKVAFSLLTGDNTVVYKACPDFREKYGYIFPIGSTRVWNSEDAMLTYADKMIWFSFLFRSRENDGPRWFTKDITTDSWRNYTFLPDWDERFGNESKSSLWILLRNQGKVWPVHVIHNQFGEGWADFWDSHKLRRGFKIVFGCERTWIFDVVVLMINLEPLYYDWSTITHEFQEASLMPMVIDDLGTPRHLRTSCFPSTMSTKERIMQFGYDCGSGKCIFKVFGKRFRDFCHDIHVDEVFIQMRNKWWAVPRINNRIDRASLAVFFNDLNLQPLDFLLVTAFDDMDVNVIVFTGDGIERVYPWT
ncbi:hypothetical protein RHGRI_024588 [Rhododendron griersonianum]|uniref:F-box associated domain-containing protein n=1 Tax=Rhododendron griersonianum TaxID=479676 RepID=A0AAV6J7Q1_9ERIC|nr:hypothetical protein RHGRI_024588 [Rhododendron griersonianum]KAG5537201.1 hypothetical protein RHGRI_024588 [Rhododendron griersonianum]